MELSERPIGCRHFSLRQIRLNRVDFLSCSPQARGADITSFTDEKSVTFAVTQPVAWSCARAIWRRGRFRLAESMTFAVSAVVHETATISGVRHTTDKALQLALDYHRQGYSNIRVTSEDAVFTLEQFRMLVE